jgi:hypothetical protein
MVVEYAPMFIGLRVWWYEHFVKREAWPPDVVEYIYRSSLEMLKKANLSPEQQSEIAKIELAAVLESENLGGGLRSELLGDALERLGEIPLEDCASCKCPVFTHEAIRIGAKPYCKDCGNRKMRQS